ncbi:MAG TPA: YraN family protein [Campylobacterales bacterium]|nr:YraN family protein [Campylobacterales bacterium]
MNYRKGFEAENRAIEYLQNLNFKIITRNFYTSYGEIDIVASKNSILHFVEVKSNRSFHPAYNITSKKMARILQSIDIYLSQHSEYSNMDISVDILTIFNGEIEFIENISLI